MVINLHTLLLIAAFVCFVLKIIGVAAKIDLIATGLALWVLAGII
jgi:hypothetical protein